MSALLHYLITIINLLLQEPPPTPEALELREFWEVLSLR
jgi:hypothetical protein